MLLLDHLISLQQTSKALLLSRIPSAKAATRLHNLSYQYIPFERQFYGNTSNDDHKGSIHLQKKPLHAFTLLSQVFLQPSILHISWTCCSLHALQTYNNHI